MNLDRLLGPACSIRRILWVCFITIPASFLVALARLPKQMTCKHAYAYQTGGGGKGGSEWVCPRCYARSKRRL